MLVEVTKSIADPVTGGSLHDAWTKTTEIKRAKGKEKEQVSDSNLVDVRIGSGSDHTVFLNHDGVPVIGLQFDGPYGVYHSVYDDFYWMNHFGDPGYRYHSAMSQLWGVVALRLANAELLPFDFQAQAQKLREFVVEIQKKKDAEANLDLRPLLRRVDAFEAEGRALNQELMVAAPGAARKAKDEANRRMMAVERNWLNPDGIPGRPWFKHTLYAARYTYAHLELPGLTEAVEKGDWSEAKKQAAILEAAVEKNTALLRDTREGLISQQHPAAGSH
jgi:N-acetylated-alpha-linked acidic dipeptidase